jgi:hypothetical protein
MMVAEERRQVLIDWMHERPEHSGLTALQIVEMAGIYEGHYRYDRCFDDLKALKREGYVDRRPARPARWDVVTA